MHVDSQFSTSERWKREKQPLLILCPNSYTWLGILFKKWNPGLMIHLILRKGMFHELWHHFWQPSNWNIKNSRKSVTWSAVPNASKLEYVRMRCWEGQGLWRGGWPIIPHRINFSGFWKGWFRVSVALLGVWLIWLRVKKSWVRVWKA